jgi:hypothetical protein
LQSSAFDQSRLAATPRMPSVASLMVSLAGSIFPRLPWPSLNSSRARAKMPPGLAGRPSTATVDGWLNSDSGNSKAAISAM